MKTPNTIRMRPDAAHKLALATKALADLGLTVWQVGALATASDIADEIADPQNQWEEGATLVEVAEAWCEDAYDMRSDQIFAAEDFLLAAGEHE